jgi:hypothetical protein
MYKIFGFILIILPVFSCHNQGKKNAPTAKVTLPINTQNNYTLNTSAIKKQLALQDHLEKSEDGEGIIYNYSTEDMLIALPLIAQGLTDNGFITIDQVEFYNKLKTIFGDILTTENYKVKSRDKFTTIFVKNRDSISGEFDYSIDNIFVSNEYRFITKVPLLGDFIEFTDESHYTIELNKKLIALNKYLFNNSQPDLAYLLHEDSLFLKTLVKSFGYTKEPKINDLAMNDYLNMDTHQMSTVGEIIFVKNANGVLEIKEELLKWISDHTRVNDNRIAEALSKYVDALYDDDNINDYIYTHRPFTHFSLHEKRKIVAFAANTYDPLYDKFTQENSRIWPATGILENLLVRDEGLADYLKQQHYFSLPALKNEIEPEEH